VRPGDYKFTIGSAGSTTPVLQTILPPLMCASAPSTITLEGGMHNPMCPPVDFIEHAFLPILARMGAPITVSLERHGFNPAGGRQ
jgi:RNA 3'-terminal phosphate cyclase (ATP)